MKDFEKDISWHEDQHEILHFTKKATLDDLYVAYCKGRKTTLEVFEKIIDSPHFIDTIIPVMKHIAESRPDDIDCVECYNAILKAQDWIKSNK